MLENILQNYIGFYLDGDNLRKAKVESSDLEGKIYRVRYLDNNEIEEIELEERNDWKYLYTPNQIMKMMAENIFKHTEGKINSYTALYEYKHQPMKLDYNDGEFTVTFSIFDFDACYIKLLFGIGCTIEDIFCLDGVQDFENKFVMSHDYCQLSFKIPNHYREWAMVEVD